MSRHNRPKEGQIIDCRGVATDITGIRFDENAGSDSCPSWWGGGLMLSWGAIVRPGTFRLILKDGRSGYIVIDDIKSIGDGSEFALFHGDGPPPF
jgi:hypothetical protein